MFGKALGGLLLPEGEERVNGEDLAVNVEWVITQYFRSGIDTSHLCAKDPHSPGLSAPAQEIANEGKGYISLSTG